MQIKVLVLDQLTFEALSSKSYGNKCKIK